MSSRKPILIPSSSDTISTDTSSEAKIIPFAKVRLEHMLTDGIERHLGRDATLNVHLEENFPLEDEPGILSDIVEHVISALAETLKNTAFQYEDEKQADIIKSKMKCSHCGRISEAHASECETFLRDNNDKKSLKIGDTFIINPSNISSEYYIKVNKETEEATHFVEGWWCNTCANVNWLEIVIEADTIQSIWTVMLTPELLQRVHYLSSEVIEFVAEDIGKPPWSIGHDEVLQILSEKALK